MFSFCKMTPGHSSLLAMSTTELVQHYREIFIQDEMALVGHPDGKYVMFRKEDTTAWLTFTAAFTILIIFDNFILNRKHERIGMLRAAVQTVMESCIFSSFDWLFRLCYCCVRFRVHIILPETLSVDSFFHAH